MGSVSTNDLALHTALRALQSTMGQAVSAEDCFLVQRGLDTLALRLETQSAMALRLAGHLQQHPMVREVLHPALDTFKTHALWKEQLRSEDRRVGKGCVRRCRSRGWPYN